MDTKNKIKEGLVQFDNLKQYNRYMNQCRVKGTQHNVKQLLIQELHENRHVDDTTK